MGAGIDIGEPSLIAYGLLFVASTVLALTRLRDVIGPNGRGGRLYVLDLVAAVAVVFGWERFADLAATLSHDRVPYLVAAGFAAGLAGMATTGFVASVTAVLGGGGSPVIAWFVTPLLVGAALRNIRLAPEPPPRVGVDLGEDHLRWLMRHTFLDLFWGLAARLVYPLPLVFVLLVPPADASHTVRITGAVVLWLALLLSDRARRLLLIRHRRAARTTDIGLFLVLLAVAAGPDGELMSRWWAAHATETGSYVLLAGPVVLLLYGATTPRFDRWRLSWLAVGVRRVLIGLPQIALVCTTLPFLVVGVFHPAREPLPAAIGALLFGLVQAALSAWSGDGFARSIADALVLVRATPREQEMLLAGWRNDRFFRRRGMRTRTWDYTHLPRVLGVLAHLGAESAHATTSVHTTLPWGGSVRVDHTLAPKCLALAEQALDEVDRTLPRQMSTPGTLGHRIQQTARADLAGRRSTVAQYLDDFEGVIAASRQAAGHYTRVGARAHAATEIIHAANRLSSVGQHEAAAALLAEVPDDLPPPVRRLSLVIRAAAAQRAGRVAAARTLLAAARAIPDSKNALAFHKVFTAERIKFPAFAKGTYKALVTTERELDQMLGTTPAR